MTKNYTMDNIFVDTGAFIALNDKSDQYHQVAAKFFRSVLNKSNYRLFTSNLVISETYTRILYRTRQKIAIKFLDIIQRGDMNIIYSDRKTELQSIGYLKKYDEKISYTDAVSFQIMKNRRIKDAFAFDRHFMIAGFNLLPGGR